MALWFLLVFIRILKGILFPVGTFSGGENYLHSFQRERNKIRDPGNYCPEGIVAYKLSMLYTYLMSHFCLSLQKSIGSVMLDDHKFKRKAREGKRNKMIIDLQQLYDLFSPSIPLLPGM